MPKRARRARGARARQARRPRARLRRRPRRRVRLSGRRRRAMRSFTISRLAQRLLGALRQRTPRGRLYEVDTRLRPTALRACSCRRSRRGGATTSKDARLWERQALMKLRPVAGDRGARRGGRAGSPSETVYGDPSRCKRRSPKRSARCASRIERELGGKYDLKVGAGGVIDVEFAAQFLQLVHGHAHPALRTTSTSAALRAAATLGIAPAGLVELLDQGYRFMRGIEHRLRVVHDQPIHRLPEARDELDRLARRSGFPERRHAARARRALAARHPRGLPPAPRCVVTLRSRACVTMLYWEDP